MQQRQAPLTAKRKRIAKSYLNAGLISRPAFFFKFFQKIQKKLLTIVYKCVIMHTTNTFLHNDVTGGVRVRKCYVRLWRCKGTRELYWINWLTQEVTPWWNILKAIKFHIENRHF